RYPALRLTAHIDGLAPRESLHDLVDAVEELVLLPPHRPALAAAPERAGRVEGGVLDVNGVAGAARNGAMINLLFLCLRGRLEVHIKGEPALRAIHQQAQSALRLRGSDFGRLLARDFALPFAVCAGERVQG